MLICWLLFKIPHQTGKSYIRVTSDFLLKLKSLSSMLSTSILAILVTVDINSLYTNIDHEEGVGLHKKLETRKNKTVPSNTLKSCILLILKFNIFCFCNTFHIQKRGQQWVPQWQLIMQIYLWTCLTLCEKCSYSGFFWSVFSRIRLNTERYGYCRFYIDDQLFWTVRKDNQQFYSIYKSYQILIDIHLINVPYFLFHVYKMGIWDCSHGSRWTM